MRIVIAMGMMSSFPVGSRAEGRSIVGTWAPDPATCTPAAGMIDIGAKSLSGDEFLCRFRTVGRAGDVVTWHGQCGFPEDAKTSTVIATLAGGALTVDIDGGRNGPYRRCKPAG